MFVCVLPFECLLQVGLCLRCETLTFDSACSLHEGTWIFKHSHSSVPGDRQSHLKFPIPSYNRRENGSVTKINNFSLCLFILTKSSVLWHCQNEPLCYMLFTAGIQSPPCENTGWPVSSITLPFWTGSIHLLEYKSNLKHILFHKVVTSGNQSGPIFLVKRNSYFHLVLLQLLNHFAS